MTRIENEPKSPYELDEMQDEIKHLKKQLRHKQSRKFFNCRSCAILILLVFIISGSVLTAIIAKSGLWQIPFFSGYFYHQPMPVYGVQPAEFDENDLLKRLEKIAGSEALIQKKTNDLKINFKLTESELSALFMGLNKEGKALAGQIKSGQIALASNQAELFFEIKSPRNLIITLNFVPAIKDGKLALKVEKFKIGDLSLPGFLGGLLVEDVIADSLNNLLVSLAQTGRLVDIKLADREILIDVLINKLDF